MLARIHLPQGRDSGQGAARGRGDCALPQGSQCGEDDRVYPAHGQPQELQGHGQDHHPRGRARKGFPRARGQLRRAHHFRRQEPRRVHQPPVARVVASGPRLAAVQQHGLGAREPVQGEWLLRAKPARVPGLHVDPPEERHGSHQRDQLARRLLVARAAFPDHRADVQTQGHRAPLRQANLLAPRVVPPRAVGAHVHVGDAGDVLLQHGDGKERAPGHRCQLEV
mmetsp:Transcript_40732/g.118847  ORF Transcript_40732/g.118847 Transcript_40732/m.118847 type:complete len:224 (-) Transcript_40732:41-712(-)